jgi:V8-like Glu-specific endopeptidase
MNIGRRLFILSAMALGIVTIFGAVRIINQNLSLDDSSALYGGELEKGYPSAGYLISYGANGGLKTCGFSVLNKNVAITASHCVDDSTDIYVGKGDFNLNPDKNIKIIKATQKEQWVANKDRSNDFAILNFEDNSNYFQVFAQIASPVEGCNYRVVAYGRTGNSDEDFTKPRKSAILCASDIKSTTFMVKGKDAGICFGDSGSPVYFNGSETVAGVVVSIVLEDPNDSTPCKIGNTAIVVRADANQNLINENIESIAADLQNIEVADGLTIQVADETLWDKIGLGSIPENQRLRYLLYVTSAGVVLLLIVLLVTLTRKPKDKKPSYYS